MKPTPKSTLGINQVEPTSDPLQVRRLVNRLASRYRDASDAAAPDQVYPVEAAVVWLWSLLRKRSPVTADQVDYLVEELQENFVLLFTDVETFFTGCRPGEKVPVYQLAFVDNTFCCLTGLNHYVDLRDGARRDSLSQAPIEVVSYNLTALFAFHWHRIHATEPDHAASQPDRQSG